MKKKKYTIRKFINDIHLWLGLASGIILFLVCLSGTLLVFEKEIKSIYAQEMPVSAEGSKMTIDEVVSAVSAEGELMSITVPEGDKAYEARIKDPEGGRRGKAFEIDPYSGDYREANSETPLDEFFWTMFRLHRWLLFDSSIGRPIVGIATIIFFFLSLSGIVLWFPKKMKWKNFKPGFKIKFSAKWKRINHDLHNTLGFYSCIFLVIMILTGLCWSFEWYRDAGSAVMGSKIFNRGGGPEFASEGAREVSAEDVLIIANGEFPHEGEITISFPNDESGVFQIRKYNSSSLSPVISDKLVIDQQGKILNKEIFNDKPLNERITSLIKPLHTGEIFGLTSKIIYFIACLIATSLPVTGTFIWINKMKKKPRKGKIKTAA